MSVEDLDRIDFIGTTAEGKVELSISDHLDWSDEESHSLILQDKIFVYLEFIESGQLIESYPDAEDKEIIISIKLQFPPSENGLIDLENMAAFFTDKPVDFNWVILDEA